MTHQIMVRFWIMAREGIHILLDGRIHTCLWIIVGAYTHSFGLWHGRIHTYFWIMVGGYTQEDTHILLDSGRRLGFGLLDWD